MYIDELRFFCLSLKGTREGTPFDASTLVFYVMDKMFCLTNIDHFDSINVKCDPEKAIELRETYAEITPGYHMNKKHWNTVSVKGRLSDDFIKQLISSSYHLVIQGLPKKAQKEWESLPEQTAQ